MIKSKNGNSDDSLYVPNTALSTDIRLITHRPVQRIAAILIKSRSEKHYSHLTYIAKGIAINDRIFATMFTDKVDIDNLQADFPIPMKPLSDDPCSGIQCKT